MKKLIIVACIVALAGAARVSAQLPNAYKIDNPALTAAFPYTVIKVDVVVEKETIRKGPYARFAQKYLGTIAPLNDKDNYTLRSADISYSDPNTTSKPGRKAEQARITRDKTEFPKVSIDRLSSAERGLEEQAQDAANMIYTIRKRRFELITGELGDSFGGGMKSALKELDRMEREYMALFFGKTSKMLETRTFEIIPQKEKVNYIVFRFSATAGVMPESDLSATPVVLSLAPDKTVQATPAAKGAKSVAYYRIADFVQCTVTGSSGELTKSRIPVYQFGETVAVAQ